MNVPVLVAYASKYGATAEIAEHIAAELRRSNLAVTVALADQVSDLAPYHAVVLGSAVYAGQWRKEAAEFLQTHADALAALPVWLFSSGPTGEGEPAAIMGGWRFPEALRALADRVNARDIAFFHGKIEPGKLHFAEKLIIKAMKVKTGDFRSWDTVRAWAADIARALEPVAQP